MNKRLKKGLEILFRYLFVLFISFFAIEVIYDIFLPLTKYPVFYFLDIFFEAFLILDSIIIGDYTLEIFGACVASSAYFLFFILNLATPGIEISKRVKMILFSFLVFLVINIIRIIFLGVLFVNASPYFDFFHKLLWYAGSTVLVVGVWFFEVKFFKIKEIPFYTDLKYLYNHSTLKKK
ncbi:MAG: pacearchaeosortase [Nanoarchaeota archaeon]|nr:pacearchaeosortase [Nanoarchaeota archaeon]